MRSLVYILSSISILALVDYFLRGDIINLDGASGEVWGLITAADTKYSVGYSDTKFRQLKIGMTERQVIQIVGKPLIRWQPFSSPAFKDKNHYVALEYSESPPGTNYRLRQVYLNGGRVAEINSYYYLD
jgi:hypothetical protein